MKKCTKCKIDKPESEYYKNAQLKSGLRSECKNCSKDHAKQPYVRKHRTELMAKWRKENPDRAKAINQKAKANRKDKIREYERTDGRKAYRKNRNKKLRQTDPMFKMKANLVSRTSIAFKTIGKGKPVRTTGLLGTSYEIVKNHIENQFRDEMTWQNYGEWHIDHIIPLSSAKDLDELVALCHYSNLQPLWAKENRLKSNKVLYFSGIAAS